MNKSRRRTDAQRRADLLEAVLASRISHADYDRRIAQLDRRRTVLSAQMWAFIVGYVIVAAALMLGAFYGLILFFVALSDGILFPLGVSGR